MCGKTTILRTLFSGYSPSVRLLKSKRNLGYILTEVLLLILKKDFWESLSVIFKKVLTISTGRR